jgi:RNA ligase (TIGR02306 family)
MADDYKVPVTKILEIKPHTNADSLEFAVVYGFNVVVRKDQYKVGDRVLYIPIDSVLSQELHDKLFDSTSKIKLHLNRVRQIKIRGQYSQGMLIGLCDLIDLKPGIKFWPEQDYSAEFGITKYEPPAPNFAGQAKKRDKPKENPLFHKYNGVENIKWYPDLFTPEEDVVVQEKLHGSNCRAAILPYQANTLWKKLVKFLGLAPKFEYCYGSNNVQLQERKHYKGFYGTNVYGAVLEKVKAFEKMKPNEIIYGELIGEGIQKNYHYGHKDHHFVLFNVKIQTPEGAKWLNPKEAENYAKERGFEFVPVLYEGKFNKEEIYKLVKQPSVYYPPHKTMEGIVIKSLNDYNNDVLSSAKKELKLINEAYLDKDQSDFH